MGDESASTAALRRRKNKNLIWYSIKSSGFSYLFPTDLQPPSLTNKITTQFRKLRKRVHNIIMVIKHTHTHTHALSYMYNPATPVYMLLSPCVDTELLLVWPRMAFILTATTAFTPLRGDGATRGAGAATCPPGVLTFCGLARVFLGFCGNQTHHSIYLLIYSGQTLRVCICLFLHACSSV